MKISELSVGAHVTDGTQGHSFLVAAHGHPGYPGTVLVSERLLALRPLDLPRDSYEGGERKKFGSNDYPNSALHVWLNSPDGFLGNLSGAFRSALQTSNVPYSPAPGEMVNVAAKVFLPSLAELGIDTGDHDAEGEEIALFRDFRRRYAMPTADAVAQAPEGWGIVDQNDCYAYWLRSSHPKHGSAQYATHSHSPYVFYAANTPYIGLRVLCCVDDELDVTENGAVYRVGEEA